MKEDAAPATNTRAQSLRRLQLVSCGCSAECTCSYLLPPVLSARTRVLRAFQLGFGELGVTLRTLRDVAPRRPEHERHRLPRQPQARDLGFSRPVAGAGGGRARNQSFGHV